MTDAIVVLCTCANPADAERLATALVEEGLAACVNVVAGLRSIYRWQGSIERAEETLLLIKSTQERFETLRNRILALHTYDTPEVIALPVVGGSEKYLAWLREP